MNDEQTLLQAIVAAPRDETAWLALADCLEEQGRTEQAELVRLREWLRFAALDDSERQAREKRMNELLIAGVIPAVPRLTIELAEGVPLELSLIPPGTFWMGAADDDTEASSGAKPRHQVTLTKGFWMGCHLVTWKQWVALMGDPDGRTVPGEDLPVDRVSYTECRTFCKKLKSTTGRTFTLPTEAQWEYACRAGTTTLFHYGDLLTSDLANFNGNYPPPGGQTSGYRQKVTPVGQFPPNAWGLYDLHGNLDEWNLDAQRPFTVDPVTDPRGPLRGRRSIRGGGWRAMARGCLTAFRWDHAPDQGDDAVGLRVICPV